VGQDLETLPQQSAALDNLAFLVSLPQTQPHPKQRSSHTALRNHGLHQGTRAPATPPRKGQATPGGVPAAKGSDTHIGNPPHGSRHYPLSNQRL